MQRVVWLTGRNSATLQGGVSCTASETCVQLWPPRLSSSLNNSGNSFLKGPAAHIRRYKNNRNETERKKREEKKNSPFFFFFFRLVE